MQAEDMLSRIEEYFHVLHLSEKSQDFGKILSTETSVKILEAVYNSDGRVGASSSEISDALGMGRTTVLYHLGRMQESGLIKVNPVLENEGSWTRFWDLYRKGHSDASKEQFDKLHNARMNGVKLFVPTKKGFLILPSTNAREGESIVTQALASIAAPIVERDYKNVKKASSILGAIGLLLIAMSFLLQPPLFQQKAVIDASLVKAPEMELGDVSRESMAAQPLATNAPPNLAESSLDEKSMKMPEATEPPSPQPAYEEAGRTALISKTFAYTGTLFLGSFIGFLLYSYFRVRAQKPQ